MSERALPEGTPLWAVILHDNQRDRFEDVTKRLDNLDEKVEPLIVWKEVHADQHKAADNRRNKLMAVVAGAGTLLGTIVTNVLGSTGK